MSPCLFTLSPDDCVNGGATYMFWIKQIDYPEEGVIVSTLDPNKEGFKVKVDGTGKLTYYMNVLSSQTILTGYTSVSGLDMAQYINSWVHLALIKHNDNFGLKVFVNGTEISVVAEPPRGGPAVYIGDAMNLALGKEFVTIDSPFPPKDMILDELILCNKPLSQGEINDLINL